MGVSYFLRCASCWDKLENIDDEEGNMTQDDYDEKWEKLADELDHEFYLGWGTVSIERLFKWINDHKEHGKIVFTAQ